MKDRTVLFGTLTDTTATTPGQIGPDSNGNEG